jgi:hypothetical protein
MLALTESSHGRRRRADRLHNISTEPLLYERNSLNIIVYLLSLDQCTVTRTYIFLHKFWFFSAAYYFGNWAFLVVSL